MRKRINHRTVSVELTALQISALERLLPNAISDTGSNKAAASYRQILRKIGPARLFVAPPATAGDRTPAVVKPDPDGKNAERAGWAETALRAFQEDVGTDDEDMLADLLSDLMHWCDREGYVFAEALRRGSYHYGEETSADPEVAL